MRNLGVALALSAALGACGTTGQATGEQGATAMTRWADPPQTAREDVTETLFGVRVDDPYRWLEDASDPRVQEWMRAQDAHARAALASLPAREPLARRLEALLYMDQVRAPAVRGGRLFYERRRSDQEKAIFMWRDGESGAERVLLDPNTLSEDGSTSVGTVAPSWDGRRVAFSLRENNADEATLYVMDVDSGARSTVDVIPGAKYADPQWTPDGAGFYYTWLPTDPTIPVDQRPGFAEVRYHALGTPAESDTLVHPRTGSPETFISPSLSADGRWLLVYVHHGWNSSDVWIRDLAAKDAPFVQFASGAHFSVTAWGDWLYIATDQDAPRWRVLRTRTDSLARESWQEIVPESPDAVIDELRVAGGHLVLRLMESATSRLEIRALDGSAARRVELPPIASIEALQGEPDQPAAWLELASFVTPPRVLRLDVSTGATTVWEAAALPVDPADYSIEQVRYTSKDGTSISMFLVHRMGLPRDGSAPFILGGYGGFNVNMTPRFMPSLIPWLDAGGGFALPNLRGGGEYGEAWHRAGMGAQKQNVFDDTIAAAEWLIVQGYTRPERLAIRGGSNGGLLVGAVMTQRPELFRAVLCAVPLLDMVRYHLFGSGRTWIPEYGSADTEEGFRVLHAYSPYHHVTRAPYPAVLMLSADSDDRVDPMHARKMAAALQAASTSGLPTLLRIESNAGHAGADLVRQDVANYADSYAFLFELLGVAPPPAP